MDPNSTARNHKDSIKSTWRRADRSQWTVYHWLMHSMDLHHVSLDQQVPVHAKQDKVPYLPGWYFHRWILVHACVPLLLHHAYASYVGRNPSVVVVYLFYSVALNLIAIREVKTLRRLGHVHGFFDGDQHERDGVPDVGVKKVFLSLDRKSTRLNSSHSGESRMPSSA